MKDRNRNWSPGSNPYQDVNDRDLQATTNLIDILQNLISIYFLVKPHIKVFIKVNNIDP